jgi:hypothetical protein
LSLKYIAVTVACLVLVTCSSVRGRGGFFISLNEGSLWTPLADNSTVFLREGEEAFIKADAADAAWFINSPVPLDYDNSGCESTDCVQEIRYTTTELKSFSARRSVELHSVPQLYGMGTHELILRAADGRTVNIQVVVRRDDSYVGYLSEMLGVPFVYWPRLTAKGHQTDFREGADCVSLAIYGKRRQGHDIPYVAPARLYDLTTVIGNSYALEDVSIAEGDILHFGFQTAVIFRDSEPVGRLDAGDIIIHTYHKSAEMRPFGELPYREMDFDILRWRM